jgi:hypothetical protein
MERKNFSNKEIRDLQLNPYVKKVSEKSITYTQEFREFFISEYQKGMLPSQILKAAGFDTVVLGRERVKSLCKRIRKMEERPEGLADTRKGNSGRTSTRDLTMEEEIRRLKNKIQYLEQENEYLKKIRFLDRIAQQKLNLKKSLKSSKKLR